jgi:putative PIN family toxin of toxin-antitoxin system
MRVVLDTNVFISGVFFGGPPYQILKAWRDGEVQVVLSAEILDEYQRVGHTLGEQFPDIDIGRILELLAVEAELVAPSRLPHPVCKDPDDDKFLACAMASGTKFVISGDKQLLQASGYRGIEVLTPRRFLNDHLGMKREG